MVGIMAQAGISGLIGKLEHIPKDGINWTEEEIQDLLGYFSAFDKVKEYPAVQL